MFYHWHNDRNHGISGVRPRALLGTVDFMAPEQAFDSKAVDGRADVYSLGCTLYFLLKGSPPFPGETAVETMLARVDTGACDVMGLGSMTVSGMSAPVTIPGVAVQMMAEQALPVICLSRIMRRVDQAGGLILQMLCLFQALLLRLALTVNQLIFPLMPPVIPAI